MPKNDCNEFEKAVYADSAVGPELQRHVEGCERCSSLQEVVALSALPAATERTDPFAAAVIAAAKEISKQRGADLGRRRRIAPLLIGTAGYLIAICGLVSAGAGGGSGRAVSAPAPEIVLPALPIPDPVSVVAVLLASVAAMAVVAFITRGRRLVSL